MQLNNKVFGTGKDVIILHGLFGMLDNWQTIGKQLAADYRVWLVDQRNHGKSPHTDSLSYYSMSDDLHEFIEEHDLDDEPVIVIGHSMGGKTAMQFAMDTSEYVDKLIVIDIAPKEYPPGHQAVFDGFAAVDLARVQNRKDADALMATKVDDWGVRQFLLKNLTRKKEGGYAWKCNLPVLVEDYDMIIDNTLEVGDQFEGETLFIKGGKSARYIVPDEDWDIIQYHFPNAKLEIVEEAGHWVHAEKPKELLEIIRDFLK